MGEMAGLSSGSMQDPAGWVRRVALNRLLNGDGVAGADACRVVSPLPGGLSGSRGGRVSSEVRVYDPDDMGTPVAVHAVDATEFGEFWISPDGLAVDEWEFGPGGVSSVEVRIVDGLERIPGQPAAVPTARGPVESDVRAIAITWAGRARTWEFPSGWELINLGPASRFGDGSLMLLAGAISEDEESYWVRVRPDGTAVRWPQAVGDGSPYGDTRVARDEMILLGRSDDGERFQVVRYRLFPAADDRHDVAGSKPVRRCGDGNRRTVTS